MKSLRVFAFATVFFILAPLDVAAACDAGVGDGQTNIMRSSLALPEDQQINFANLGEVMAIALDDCVGLVYEANFDRFIDEAKAGNAEAQDKVGLMYAHGAGTTQDWTQSLFWLKKAADQESASANYRLGAIAQYGLTGEPDFKAAESYYRKSSELGQGYASTNLGVMHLQGIGMEADASIAFNYFKLAAQQGDAAAYGNLGILYLQGLGVSADPAEALKMFRAGASLGSVVSMRMLAFNLGQKAKAEGDGRGILTALMWATVAANKGDAVAKKLVDGMKQALAADEIELIGKRAQLCESSEFKNCE